MKLRTMVADDYPSLVPFWKKNYFVNDMDSAERFTVFLKKNPNLSVLVEDDGKIIGTLLGSFDGRRGYLQKVVTDKGFRGKGVGRRMVAEVLKRMKALGVLYIPLAVEENVVAFYEHCGFRKTTQVPMNINL